MDSWMQYLEIAKAVGALATPFVVAVVAYAFQRRQKVAEATMTERVRRIGAMSPLLNKIYSYRQRIGNYLEWSPDEILAAKREADREFWTYEYLWSQDFHKAYHEFMDGAFETHRGEGNRAGIRAESRGYPKQTKTPGWVAFTEQPLDKAHHHNHYKSLQSGIAKELGFRK